MAKDVSDLIDSEKDNFERVLMVIWADGWKAGYAKGDTDGVKRGQSTLTNAKFFWVWFLTLIICFGGGIGYAKVLLAMVQP